MLQIVLSTQRPLSRRARVRRRMVLQMLRPPSGRSPRRQCRATHMAPSGGSPGGAQAPSGEELPLVLSVAPALTMARFDSGRFAAYAQLERKRYGAEAKGTGGEASWALGVHRG